MLANIHSILDGGSCCRVSLQCTLYTQCRLTHPSPVQCWASVAAHCRFNAGQSSTTLTEHYSNACSAVYFAVAPQPTPSTFDANPIVKSHRLIVPCLLRLRHCYAGDTFSPCRRKGHYPYNTIHWTNAGPLSAMLGQHYSNLFPLISNHEYNCGYIFSQQFLNTQLFDLGTSNVIFDLFISPQPEQLAFHRKFLPCPLRRCQPFPTHRIPLSAK